MPVLDPATSPVLAPATAPKKPSVFEDFIDIYYAPGQVFARRRDGEFFAALATLTLAVAVLGILFYNLMEPGFSAMADVAIEQARAKQPKFDENAAKAVRGVMTMSTKYGPIVFTPIAALLGAVVIWLVSKFFDAAETFGQAMTISTYSMFPLLLASIAMAATSFLVAPENVHGLQSYMLSPARFFDPRTTNAGLMAFLTRIELFQFWGVYITGVGIAELGRVSRGKGMAAAITVWLVGTLLQAGPAALR